MTRNTSRKENHLAAIEVEPKPKRTVHVENIGNLAAALKHSTTIPHVYHQPEELRPNVPFDGFSEKTELIPIVDMQALSSTGSVDDRQRMIGNLGHACKEWGFFQIINHGVSIELIKRLRELAIGFFEQPAAEKEKASVGQVGYEGRHAYMPERVHWLETLALLTGPVQNIEDVLNLTCYANRKEFVATVIDYTQEVQSVGLVLLEAMAESLDLERDFFAQHFGKGSTSVTRFNYYPPCPQPSMALGLFPHEDANTLTILYQDEIGGLQILKDGEWICVKPKNNAFVVNIGDSLQAWTNGHFKSVTHRAVLNSVRPRISVACFNSPIATTLMAPPSKLVDENHPLLYRPFTWADYFPRMQKKRMEGKVGVDTFMRLDHKEEEEEGGAAI